MRLPGPDPIPCTGSGRPHRLGRIPEDLYHYTCPDAAARIAVWGELVPALTLNPDHPELNGPWRPIGEVVWLTDLAQPGNLSLGFDRLQVHHHGAVCDRMAVRFRVLDAFAEVCARRIRWWPSYARTERTLRELREALEGRTGARPSHWFVSREPVRVELDEGWPG